MIINFKEISHDKFFIRAFIFGIILNALCFALFMCSPQVVHAASEQTYFPMRQNGNNKYSERDISQIERFLTPSSNYYFCWVKSISSGQHQYYYVYWPKSANAGIIATTSGYQFNLSYYGSTTFTCGYLDIKTQNNYHGNYVMYTGDNPTSYIQGTKYSSVYSNTDSYLSNISIYDSTNVDTRRYVLIYGDYIEIPEDGDPSAPNMTSLDLDSSLNTTTIPTTPTYSNNFNDSLPTYDPTAPIESLVNIVIWCFNRVHSFFESFREYLFSWLGYFINILTYLIQKIIDAIKYIVTWIYNQFLNWLTPYLKIIRLISGFLFDEKTQKSIFDLILDFFGAVAQWLAQFWQNSFIVNFWTNYVSNLENIIEDVLDKIDDVITAIDNVRLLFTRDPDYSLIVISFYSTYFGQVYQAVMRLLSAIVDGFTSIQAPGTLSFTVNFSSAPAPFDSVGYLTFNFDWYENIRAVVVPIITTCVYFGFALHIVWSWRCMLMDTASLKPDVTIQPYSPTPGKAKVNYTSSGAAGGGLVPTWRTYPGQKRIRG